jgi:hypothetical protein
MSGSCLSWFGESTDRADTTWPAEGVFWLGFDFGGGAKKPDESFAGGFSCAFLEEIGSGLSRRHFLGDGHRDPLVQRYAIFFRKPLRSWTRLN